MRGRYIKRRELFDRQARRLMQKLGAKSDPTYDVPWSCYRLDTKAGPLRLSVHTALYCASKPWFIGGGSPWVAGRFDDVKRAVAVLGTEVNRFSGKWNHHCWHNWTDRFDTGLAILEYNLRRII